MSLTNQRWALLACMLVNGAVQADDWQPVGSPGFSAGEVNYTSLAISSGVPYVAYSDGGNGDKATVMKYNGTAWESVGNPGFSARRTYSISLSLSDETPYVAYQDEENSGKVTVMKYNGTTWKPVGISGFSMGWAGDISLVISNGVPYVAYRDGGNSGKATVMKYNGTTWESVGNQGFSTKEVWHISLALSNGVPYVAYEDGRESGKATVMKYNGTTWESVGSPEFSAGIAWFTSLAISNGVPYVAYQDQGNDRKTAIMKYNGTTWESVGSSPSFSTVTKGCCIDLAIFDGVPYVAYSAYENFGTATVMKYNGTTWESVGNPGFSAGQANSTSLAISDGVLYVAYEDWSWGMGGKATVMKYAPTNVEIPCCSYIDANNNLKCPSSLDSITFEECKDVAREDGAKRFKWGMVDQATVNACGISGCGDVQEYLGVTLDNLTTSISENQLVIQWDTASEENNLGMNLWCAQIQGNQFKKITQLNSQLIPSKAILPNYGASYSSIDYLYVNTNLKPGVQHCALEDIDASGQCTLHCDQIDTVVVGEGNSVSDPELNKLRTKAIALCNEHKPEGLCLDQLLAPHQ